MSNRPHQDGFSDHPVPTASQLQKLIDLSLDVICTFDRHGNFTQVSKAALKVWGYHPHEMIGKSYTGFVVKEDLIKTQEAAHNIIKGTNTVDFENRYQHKNGSIVTMQWSGQWDEEDETVFCVARNTSERKEREALQESFEKKITKQNQDMTEMLERITDSFFVMDEEWRITYANSQVERSLGINREDYLKRSFWDCFPDMVGSDFYIQYHKAMSTKEPVHFEAWFPPFQKWLAVNAYPSSTGLSVFFRDYTEQKKLEEERTQYEEKIKAHHKTMVEVLEQMTDGFIVLGAGGKVIYWNKEAERLSNVAREAILGKSIWEVYPYIKDTEYYQLYQQSIANPGPIHTEVFSAYRQRWIDLHIYPTEAGISVFFRDITDRKIAEEEHRQYEKKIRQQNRQLLNLIEGMREGFYSMDKDFRVLYWNKQMGAISGFAQETVLGNVFPDLLADDAKNFYLSLFRQVLASQKPFHKEVQCPINGKWTDLSIYPTEEGLSIFVTDITERKEAEEEMHKLSLIATETQNAVSITAPDTTVTWINEAFTRITGYTREEITGKKMSEVLGGPETSAETINYLYQQYAKGEAFHAELINYKKNGEAFWSELHGQPLFDEDGGLKGFFCIRTDVTERKKAEEELHKLSLVAQLTDNIVGITSPSHKIIWVNAAFTRITGYSFDEVIGKTPAEVFDGPETDKSVVKYVNEKWKNQDSFHVEAINYKKNGETYWAEISCQPVFDEKGALQHFFSMSSDITERKMLQQKVDEEKVKRQQMITAAVIAAQEKVRAQVGRELHDNVNQVLTTVKLYTELCRDGLGDTGDIMDKSIKYLQESIDEIRSLSKRLSAPMLGNIKLKDSVKELLETISATNKIVISLNTSGIEALEVEQETHLALYRILQEQFTNILKHADAETVEVLLDFIDGTLLMRVKDDGKGFDTKQKRNGIGITNMATRAESLKGTFEMNSAPGLGCELVVRIPLDL